jgi:hypothetical protein
MAYRFLRLESIKNDKQLGVPLHNCVESIDSEYPSAASTPLPCRGCGLYCLRKRRRELPRRHHVLQLHIVGQAVLGRWIGFAFD